MGESIGYQDGITAWADWFRKMGTWQLAFEKWAKLPNNKRATTIPPIPPKIPARGANYNPDDISTWPWPDKLERTLRILKDEHDASLPPGPGPDPPPDPDEYKRVAPKVANMQGGSNARYCCPGQPGVMRQDDGTWRDDVAHYDQDGLLLAGRSNLCEFGETPGLVGAREIDGRPYCDLPKVGDPSRNTGSWML